MDRGTLIAGRFVVEGQHAAGGMGEVHVATDLETGRHVAIKVLRWHGESVEARFAREASVLAALSHPGIVRYVAHGRMPTGNAYLVMEWVDGVLLSDRLKQGPLSIADSLLLMSRIADALAIAHARRIVHRDLKPSNLLCEAGEIGQVKILDFGLARNEAIALRDLTRTGDLAGTPGYMAPEQARGLHDVDARADVYSLGCVLFECLIGRPPFSGDHVYAVLAKILVEEAPRVSELRPEVPPALDDLVMRMLAKDPDARPADAFDLQLEIARIRPGDPAEPAQRPALGLGHAEQRVLCVILATGDGLDLAAGPRETLATTVKAHGAILESLAGGYVAVLSGVAGAMTDLAARAARCALSVSSHLPGARVAVVTGRGVARQRVPIGPAIDAAARLLARPGAATIRIDETTAGLLDPRFEVAEVDGGLALVGFAESRDAARTLLGKPSPFVGRERELANLLGLLEECQVEPVAQAVLITAPPGGGKSRLCQEFLRRAEQGGAPVQVWIGRGDPMSAGAPMSIVSRMIRREAGIRHGEPAEDGRQKLEARVARRVRPADVERVVTFVGEVCGVPFPDHDRPALRAARGDASAMGDQTRRAFEDLVAAECAAGPLILIVEELHWGDLGTVKLIDAALRTLSRRPLMVVALARPEVSALFPDLWAARSLQVVTLRPLTDREARRLVERSLGAQPDAATTALVDQAGGNPFYLEELIRAASLGHDNPGTVLAMIGARLEALPGEHRRLLRAASILGDSFWPGALHRLVGRDPGWVDKVIAELVEQEWMVRHVESARAGETEYGFRHDLVREAAYGMLTDDDRRLGHRMAAEWLAEHGGAEPMTIGEHLQRGGEPGQAMDWFARAARQALDGDLGADAAIDRARRGLACAAELPATSPDEIGRLRAILAEAYNWIGANAEAEADGLAALALAAPATTPWYAAVSQILRAAGRLGHFDRVVALAEQLRAAAVDDAAAAAWMRAAVAACDVLLILHGARNDLAAELLHGIEERLPRTAEADPWLPGRVDIVRAWLAGVRGDPYGFLVHMLRATGELERIGHQRLVCQCRHDVGMICARLGAWDRAEAELRFALAQAELLGLSGLVPIAEQNLAFVLAHRGRLDEAEQLVSRSIDAFAAQRYPLMEAASRRYLAVIRRAAGDLAAAEVEVERAVALDDAPTPVRAAALGMASLLRRERGRTADAVAAAREGMAILGQLGGMLKGEALLRLALAEALHAAGDVAGAQAAIAAARDRVQQIAGRIGDPELRASCLAAVPEHARILALAAAWAGSS